MARYHALYMYIHQLYSCKVEVFSMYTILQIKTARWPKTDLLSRKNVLESYNLANGAAWWRACLIWTRGCVMNAQAHLIGRWGVTV